MFPVFLPTRYLGYYSCHPGLFKRAKFSIKYLLGFLSYPLLKKRLVSKHYDLILINQLPYWELLFLEPQIPKIIFAREVIHDLHRETYQNDIKKISEQADKIIAIDNLTAYPFLQYCPEKVVILTNPFDMNDASEIKKDARKRSEITKALDLPSEKKIVALVGALSKEKGTDFFIDFVRENILKKDMFFIICGETKGKFAEQIKRTSMTLPNLKLLSGDQNFMQKIYGISDLVVRCDSFLPLGRTVWEAFFSHTPVLIPFNQDDSIEQIKAYVDKQIFLYPSRNMAFFRKSVEDIFGGETYVPIKQTGNQEEYGDKIHKIIQELIK